jgi:putative transcriptional regulator
MATNGKSSGRPSRLRREILVMSKDMHRLGIMDDETYRKITMRESSADEKEKPALAPLSGGDIRALRRRARMSQAVFARSLNLTPGYVSRLECGEKRATGPTLALLDVIRRKGVQAIL